MNLLSDIRIKFQKNISKGRILTFDELIEANLAEDLDESEEFNELIKTWYDSFFEMSFLPKINSKMEEVFIHSACKMVIKDNASSYNYDSNINQSDLDIFFDLITLRKGIDWNYNDPFVSFDFQVQEKKTRISLIHHSTTSDGISKMFIRITNKSCIPISLYAQNEMFFEQLIKTKKNILISGATGSGKTTFANSLLGLIDSEEHVVLIEDIEELIPPNSTSTKLITDSKSSKKSMNKYLEYALRMSPDRIILGEIRSKEVESSLLAMNTGHNGFLTTIHANSAHDALQRMALLFKIYSTHDLNYELILKLITSNIDYVIHIEDKKIKEIIDVFGSNQESIFFEALSI